MVSTTWEQTIKIVMMPDIIFNTATLLCVLVYVHNILGNKQPMKVNGKVTTKIMANSKMGYHLGSKHLSVFH